MARAALARRRSTGGLTFESVTLVASPVPRTPSDAYAAGWTLVPFNSKAGLTSAVSALAAHQYVYYSGPGALPTGTDFAGGTFYNGSGILTISFTSSGSNGFTIGGKNPASYSVFDFGAKTSVWNPSIVSGNYVEFAFIGTPGNGTNCFWLNGGSNLVFYGGSFTGGSTGILVYGNTTTVWWLDFQCHDMPGAGVGFSPVGGPISGCTFRGEVGPNWAMRPTLDNHNDKGSGIHCCLLENSSSTNPIKNMDVAIYGHDSLQPGATSFGQVWGEGAGGSVIELGSDTSGTDFSGNKLSVKAVNNTMIPNGSNPGSTAKQSGGSGINLYGQSAHSDLIIPWAEGQTISGPVVHCQSGGWETPNPSATVQHGRSHGGVGVGTNLAIVAGSGNAAPNNVPYPTGVNVVYNDCI